MSATAPQAAAPFPVLRHPLVRLVLIASVLALAHYRWLPFPWRMPAVGLLGLGLVWLETRALQACGLQRRAPRAWLGWTLLLFALVVGVVDPWLEPLIDRLIGTAADYSGYGALHGNLPAAAKLVALAWLSAAIGEELVFRGFLMHQLSALLHGFRGARAVAALLGGIAFGWMHASQGLSGMVLTGVVGSLFGYAYLRSGRHLGAMVLAHGLIDSWGVATLYLGWH